MMKEKILYIWFQMATGICNRVATEVLSRFNNIIEIYNCNDFAFLGDDKSKYISNLENKDTASAFEVMKKCSSLGVSVIGYYDELYPEQLREIKIPPSVLYAIGNVKDFKSNPCVAMVGTRNMTDYGKAVAEDFSYVLSQSGIYIISGLAKGIDTAAHRGAIKAGGYTVGVLGNPIGDIYPKENARAFETLYERGLVISEMYPGCPKSRADFPNRNRIISGLSDAVIVAEAGEGSGSLITARHATEQGKLVFAIPGTVGSGNSGTNLLIKNGTPAATEPQDIIAALTPLYPERLRGYAPAATAKLRSYGNTISKPSQNKPKPAIEAKISQKPILNEDKPVKTFSGATSEIILSALKDKKPMTADEICQQTGLNISDIMTELTMMEIDGSVIASVGGRYTSKF